MASISLFHLALSSISMALLLCSEAGRVGINYADNLPISPSLVFRLLKSQRISAVKIYHTNSSVLSAFAYSGITLTVSLPNNLLPSAAGNSSVTDSWLNINLLPFLHSTNITSIAVGNNVFSNPNLTPFLLPAMKSLYDSLQSRNLHRRIKISSPLPLSALASSYPPSTGAFSPSLVPSVISPMLSFLRQTSSFLMVNANSDRASLFQDNPDGVVDSRNGLRYNNLLDAQIDAVYYAMATLNFSDIPVIVTETGLPSKSDAAAYNDNLIRRVLKGGGTPLRPHRPLQVFISLTISDVCYNDSEVAIVPPAPMAAGRWVRQFSASLGKAKAEKLQHGNLPDTLEKNRNN